MRRYCLPVAALFLLALAGCPAAENNSAGTSTAGTNTAAGTGDSAPTSSDAGQRHDNEANPGAPGTGTLPSAGKKYTIAVIPKGTTHVFWKSIHAGAEKAAAELGNVTIDWKGPLLENDRSGQINVVQDFITKGVDGIVLAPLDANSLVDVVAEARDQGIPTVIFDSGLADEEIIVSYVATDNYQGGVLAGERLAEVLNEEGGVVMLRYNQGSESTEQRERGFLDAIAKFPKMTVLSSDQYAGTTVNDSIRNAENVLERFRDEVDGVFCVCEPNAIGMLRALENQELAGKVKFVGFDPSAELIEAMRAGHLHGIVLQDPVKMGYDAVVTMVAHLNGEEVKKWLPTGEHMATPEEMDRPDMAKLLDPEKFEE